LKRTGGAGLLALAPATALANAGIGYFMLAMPLVGVALVPAILLEAPVLRRVLRLSWRRALWLSFVANSLSTLYGLILGIAFDFLMAMGTGSAGPPPTRVGAVIMLVPWFFLSWWIELKLIARRMPDAPRATVRRATGVANLATYALMLAAALVTPLYPTHDPMLARARVHEAILAATPLRESVGEFWAVQKRFPKDLRELNFTPPAQARFNIALGNAGQVAVQIQRAGNPAIDGKWIQITPQPDGPSLKWTCSSPDLDRRILPANCRQ
jgi:hypothetical protein